ncbi:MAG: filamentous hemagglutinin N-terminal domain-containing protein, partial [Candidatus Omnitrophota bacterium]
MTELKNKARILEVGFLSLALITMLGLRPAFCLPQIDNIASGTVTVSNPDSSTLEINASDRAIINYQSFDVAQNESVVIKLPSINSAILNRVLGNSASQILGSVSCNGIFIIVNERGIFFGPNAHIDVGSLIASTRDISDTDFLSSQYIFSRLSKDQMDALILNQGQINIHNGGFGIMIAGAVENQGVITARVGTIALTAGEAVHVNIALSGKISIAIDKAQANTVLDAQGNPITDQIKNSGTLSSDGGIV